MIEKWRFPWNLSLDFWLSLVFIYANTLYTSLFFESLSLKYHEVHLCLNFYSEIFFQTEGVELLFKILQRVIDNDEAEENALDHRSMTFGALTGVMMAKEKFERVNHFNVVFSS